MSTENGTLGFTTVVDYKLYLWIREPDNEVTINGGPRWSQRRVLELDKVLPNHALLDSPRVLTIVNAVGVTFVATPSGHFSIDLKSGRVTDLFEGSDERYIVRDNVLYRTFRTPGIKINLYRATQLMNEVQCFSSLSNSLTFDTASKAQP
ncbi:hypothetical protein EJB05_13856, partial [Eragrostis curvula]